MMNESQITVGELSSFLLYAAFVGASIGGESHGPRSCSLIVCHTLIWLNVKCPVCFFCDQRQIYWME